MKKRSLVMFAAVLFAFSGLMAKVYDLTAGGLSQTADQQSSFTSVSYTHLDVYKRQAVQCGSHGQQASVSPVYVRT